MTSNPVRTTIGEWATRRITLLLLVELATATNLACTTWKNDSRLIVLIDYETGNKVEKYDN